MTDSVTVKTYLPFTYFKGSVPDNNYTPSEPFTIEIESSHVSDDVDGYMKLFIPCGGADTPRPIMLRQRGSDGKWFLWEHSLLVGVKNTKRIRSVGLIKNILNVLRTASKKIYRN